MVATVEIALMTHRAGESSTLPDSLEANEIGITVDTGEAFIGAPGNPLVQGRSRAESNQYPYENIQILTEFTDNMEVLRHAFKGANSFLQYPTVIQSSNNIGTTAYPNPGPDQISVTANGTVTATINNGDSLSTIVNTLNTAFSGGSLNTVANIQSPVTTVEPVRAATTVNGTLATDFESGDTIDTVVLAAGDRILLKNQGTSSENGVYEVQLAGAPIRVTDVDSAAELNTLAVYVREGTQAGNFYKQTSTVVVVDTDPVTFVQTPGRIRIVSTAGYDVTISNAVGTPLTYLQITPGSYTSAGALTRSLQSRLDDEVSVKAFGAQGDYSTDDSPTINRGIQALYCSGDQSLYRELRIPAGRYKLDSDSVYLAPNTVLVGDGPGNTVLIVPTGKSHVAVRTQDSAGVQDNSGGFCVPFGNRPQNVQVKNMTIEHEDDADLCVLTVLKNAVFENVEFKTSGTGIGSLIQAPDYAGQPAERLSFKNCVFKNALYAIELTDAGSDILIDNSEFEDIGSSVLTATGTSDGIVLRNSVIRDTANQNPVVFAGQNVQNVELKNNTIERTGAFDTTVFDLQSRTDKNDYQFGPTQINALSTLTLHSVTLYTDAVLKVDYMIRAVNATDSRSGTVHVYHDAVSSGTWNAAPEVQDSNPSASAVFSSNAVLGSEETLNIRLQNTTGSAIEVKFQITVL